MLFNPRRGWHIVATARKPVGSVHTRSQQAPAVGRAISELIAYRSYKSLDLSKFSYERFTSDDLIRESEIV